MTIETKYNTKDKVWYMDGNKPKEEAISAISAYVNSANNDEVGIRYIFFRHGGNTRDDERHQSEVFQTKEALLQSL